MQINTFSTTRAHGGFGGGRHAGRLRLAASLAHSLGATGMLPWDAQDRVEEQIWANGLLPADRPSQRRAWRLALDRARTAFDLGSWHFTLHVARRCAFVARHRLIPTLYATAFEVAPIASDISIMDAVGEALRESGMPAQMPRSTWAAVIWSARQDQAGLGAAA